MSLLGKILFYVSQSVHRNALSHMLDTTTIGNLLKQKLTAILDAHRRELILVIKTDRSCCKLMLWNDFALLCAAIFSVS